MKADSVGLLGPVLVIGGTGFVGRALVSCLRANGVNVCVLARNYDPDLRGVQWLKFDLLKDDIDIADKLAGFSVIFNCVGELKDESRMYALHVEATSKLLSMCRNLAAPPHWVQLSSVGAYGPSVRASDERFVSEETVLSPRGTYEVTKAMADELVISAAKQGGVTYSILRPSIIYGSGMSGRSLNQLISAIRGGRFFYIGSVDSIVPYVHVDDVARALVLCGFRSEARNQVFNVSCDVRLSDFVAAVADFYSVPRPRLRIPEFLARFIAFIMQSCDGFPLTKGRIDALVSRTYYSSGKIERVLGFFSEKSLLSDFSDVLIDN